jgi:hypothetical protein
MDCAKADEERKRGDDLEVDDGLHAHASHMFEVGMGGDAADQGGKEQRSNDRLDQPEEDQAQYAKMQGKGRSIVTNLRTQHHEGEDPRGQRTAKRGVRQQRHNCRPS